MERRKGNQIRFLCFDQDLECHPQGILYQHHLKNMEIVAHHGLIMHHVVMNCVNHNIPLPNKFCLPDYIKYAVNYLFQLRIV